MIITVLCVLVLLIGCAPATPAASTDEARDASSVFKTIMPSNIIIDKPITSSDRVIGPVLDSCAMFSLLFITCSQHTSHTKCTKQKAGSIA